MSTRGKITIKGPVRYMIGWVRKGEMTLEVLHGEKKVGIRGKIGHMCQEGVSLYQ